MVNLKENKNPNVGSVTCTESLGFLNLITPNLFPEALKKKKLTKDLLKIGDYNAKLHQDEMEFVIPVKWVVKGLVRSLEVG